MLQVILQSIATLIEIAAKLAAGKISEAEARAECMAAGRSISETKTDAELGEHEALMGDPEPPSGSSDR